MIDFIPNCNVKCQSFCRMQSLHAVKRVKIYKIYKMNAEASRCIKVSKFKNEMGKLSYFEGISKKEKLLSKRIYVTVKSFLRFLIDKYNIFTCSFQSNESKLPRHWKMALPFAPEEITAFMAWRNKDTTWTSNYYDPVNYVMFIEVNSPIIRLSLGRLGSATTILVIRIVS